MAGIGFELKKIFKEESISRIAGGAAYSTLVVVGPTIIVIGTIVLLYSILGLMSVPYNERELLSSTILYVFIFSLLTTAAFNGVMSRYIADKIYEEKYEDILPSFYTGIFLNTLVGAILGIPFIIRLIFIGQVDPIFSFVSYCFFIVMIIAFYSMIYLSATKDYKIIAIYYVVGMVIAFISANLFYRAGLSTIKAILYGMTLGFLIIAFLEFAYMRKYFGKNSRNYKECLHYFIDHKNICFCNFFYILGLYIHNFVFWTHPSHIIVAKSYVSMQSYDMASCLAMFTNISTIIIFTVMAETKFHDKYQMFNEAVIGKTLKDINRTKRSMFRLLIQQISYLVGIQAIITTIIFLMALVILPILGFSGSVLTIYPSLVVTYFAIFIMYCNIIFLFYFNDNTGAMFTSIIFCIFVLIGSVFSIKLSESLYGAGAFLGGFIGWTVSYFRIQYLEKNFDEHIFCRTNMLKTKIGEIPNSRVYTNYVKINDKWEFVKDYSTEEVLNLPLNKGGEGEILVEAKENSLLKKYDDDKDIKFNEEHILRPKINNIKCLTEKEMFVGKDIKFEVEVNNINAISGLYKFFKIYENGKVQCIQNYSTQNTIVFREEEEGKYRLLCVVKDMSSNNEYDDRALINYSITKYTTEEVKQVSTEVEQCEYVIDKPIKPIEIMSIKYNKDSDYLIGETIDLYVETSGGIDPMYSFILYDGKKEEIGYVDYYTINNVNFTPEYEGVYELEVRVRDKHSSKDYDCKEVLSFNIKREL